MSKVQYLDNSQLIELFPGGKIPHVDLLIIDVRAPGEYAEEHIEGSINLPLDEFIGFDKASYKDKVLIFHCKGGVRTKSNQHILETLASKESWCLDGGIEQWKSCGFKVVK